MKKIRKFPRGLSTGIVVAPLATSFWFPVNSLEKQVKNGSCFTYRNDRIWLGRTPTDNAEPVGWIDDRHMVTIAGSRAGKGTSAIIPALIEYTGSVICIDPKGENARLTSARRGHGNTRVRDALHQDVYVLDPYNISKCEKIYLATFDPLQGLKPEDSQTLEEAGLIADALVIGSHERDPHWDESARALIEALILHVLTWPRFEDDRTLGRVRLLLRDGDKSALDALREEAAKEGPEAQRQLDKISAFDALLIDMEDNDAFGGVIAGAAAGLKDLGDRERGSVLSTARRNLKFLDAPEMQACLRVSDHALRLEDLKRNPRFVSVYIVLPSRLMEMHSRWMRLILNLTISRLERDPDKPIQERPVLAILDEFPTLRHLPALETAVAYMAGFGLKLWAILQDLAQLKRHYPNSWETFLGNAGTLQFFGNSDPTTLEYIAKRLGEIEVIRETTNTSETHTTTISDISDFEKLKQTADRGGLERFLGSFRLENSTESPSTSFAEAETKSQSLQKTELMTPDEIRRYFSRDRELMIVALADFRPLYLRRTPYFKDRHFEGKYAEPLREFIKRES